jgi:acyl dehydratase
MAIRLDLVGRKSEKVLFRYTWKDCVLYALGVGAREDELDFLFEMRGPRVLPTFAVVPSFLSMVGIAGDLAANPMMIVHGEQKIVLHRPIPPGFPGDVELSTVSEVKAIYDKGKGAVVVVEAVTSDESGARVFDNVFSIFVRGEGGFGGERGPEAQKLEPPARAPDFEISETTSREQALLYRLSGDVNPLHADPGFARMGGFDRPILHGLATYGFAGRALLRGACGGDEKRIRSFAARFSAPVFPGDTLTTRGWDRGDGTWLLTVATQEGKQVLTNAVAEVA